MKHYRKSILWASVFIFACTCHAHAVSWIYDMDAAMRKAERESKPVMVDFYTDWCGWCKRLDQDTYTDKEVNAFSVRFVSVKVDGDKHRDLVSRYGVRGYPTILFLNSKGDVIQTIPGYMKPGQLATAMERVLRKYGEKIDITAGLKNMITSVPKIKSAFDLTGILYDGRNPKAVINDEIVQVGDTVNGAKVIAITASTVTLSRNGKESTLRIEN